MTEPLLEASMPANVPARPVTSTDSDTSTGPDTPTTPSPELEREAIVLVKQRLRRRYPDLAPERIGATVDGVYHRFDHSRVRTFVPVLVEHEAREELAGAAVAGGR